MVQPPQAYRVSLSRDVARTVAKFSSVTRDYWDVCVALIGENPRPRFAGWVERRIPILDFPVRTFNYEISQETSIAGETIFIFLAEFLPDWCPVYVVDDVAKEVEIVYLRENRWF